MRKRILTFFKNHPHNRYRLKDLVKRLKIHNRDRPAFNAAMALLVKERAIRKIKNKWYELAQAEKLAEGRLSVTQKGFGFVITDDDQPDIFISRRYMTDAIHGDLVRVTLYKSPTFGRRRGKITAVLERATERFIGTATFDGRNYWLSISPITPERGLRIVKSAAMEFEAGQVVVAEVCDWGTAISPIIVRAVEVIGEVEDPKIDFRIILSKYNYKTEFSSEILDFVKQFSPDSIKAEIPRRRDLRHLQIITIDPREARDFDDALSIRETQSGYQIGVHIADVSHFVTLNSIVDREAFNRGTSVYFTEGVVPMLPERLSADICSLVPDEDRLAMSALIDLDDKWRVIKFRVNPTVIRNRNRLTYQEAQNILDKKNHHAQQKQLFLLEKLSKVLSLERMKTGSIDFDIPEPILTLRHTGIPQKIYPSVRLQSHRIVEECMLLANRLVARNFGIRNNKSIPFIYRIHDKPAPEDVERFLALLKVIGIRIPDAVDPSTSKGLRDILISIQDSPYRMMIESLALRTMTKARYTTESRGHFGLAFEKYTHFTSPIRRYPDLVIHRRIKDYLSKQIVNEETTQLFLKAACDTSNAAELTALDAEREYIKIKQLRWLNEHIGEEFDGIISGVTNFGFFVELTGSMAEGLVHIDSLADDVYIYHEEEYCYRAKQSRQEYRLGNRVKVRVLSVTFEKQRANFVLTNYNQH